MNRYIFFSSVWVCERTSHAPVSLNKIANQRGSYLIIITEIHLSFCYYSITEPCAIEYANIAPILQQAIGNISLRL